MRVTVHLLHLLYRVRQFGDIIRRHEEASRAMLDAKGEGTRVAGDGWLIHVDRMCEHATVSCFFVGQHYAMAVGEQLSGRVIIDVVIE